MEDLKIAAVCMRSIPGEVGRNLDRIQTMASDAADEGADFVCFPELSVTGYMRKGPPDPHTGTANRRIVDRLARMAMDIDVVLMAGFMEMDSEGRAYITQAVTGPDGLIGLYRKTHLAPTEAGLYSRGDRVQVYRAGGSAFGVLLCYEAHFPELSTTLALSGAEVLFIPHASPRGTPDEKLESWLRHLPARAFDNGIFVVACNQVGETGEGLVFPGVAVVLGPDGRVLAQYRGEAEHILFSVLEAETLKGVRKHRMKYFLPERRPDIYKRNGRL